MNTYAMRACPFCKERIHADATRCRYCTSSFAETAVTKLEPTSDERHVVYVVDRDLIRFAKFALAILAMFLAVGAYSFGFTLETALEKVRAVQNETIDLRDKLIIARGELDKAKEKVAVLKLQVENILGEADAKLRDIRTKREEAYAYINSMKDRPPLLATKLDGLRAEKPQSFRRGTRFWPNEATLRVRFLDGEASQQAVVKAAIARWLEFINLQVVYETSGPAEVRISFRQQGAWSHLGTDGLAIEASKPTMNLQWVDYRTALHEFGHVLGLVEEHLNPASSISWNRELVYTALSGPPNLWRRDQIEKNVFQKYSASELGTYRAFDPESIMTMEFPTAWTGGIVMGKGRDLSESDKSLVAKLYPRGKA